MSVEKERAEIAKKGEIKLLKQKLQILKEGIRKQRAEKATLQQKNRELKERNKVLEGEMKKKDDKYEASLTEIRDLKNTILLERNQRQKVELEFKTMLEKHKTEPQLKTGGTWGNYLGGLLKRN